jgi:hypothetical protein
MGGAMAAHVSCGTSRRRTPAWWCRTSRAPTTSRGLHSRAVIPAVGPVDAKAFENVVEAVDGDLCKKHPHDAEATPMCCALRIDSNQNDKTFSQRPDGQWLHWRLACSNGSSPSLLKEEGRCWLRV